MLTCNRLALGALAALVTLGPAVVAADDAPPYASATEAYRQGADALKSDMPATAVPALEYAAKRGVLGAQVGRGNGRVAGAAVGAGVGAVTGDVIANQNNAGTTVTTTAPVQRCRQVDNFQAVTTGYMVTYEYDGQRFSTRLAYNPGNQLKVNVAVTPR